MGCQSATATEPFGASFKSDVPISSEGRALYSKDGCSRLMKMCWPVVGPALHQDFETESFPMPARRDIDLLEFHLVAGRGPHESDARAGTDRSSRAQFRAVRMRLLHDNRRGDRDEALTTINMTLPDRLPSIWLQRLIIDGCAHANVDGRTVIVCSMNSIPHRCETAARPRRRRSSASGNSSQR